MHTEQLLCWSGMTNTEHTTSISNEEDYYANVIRRPCKFFSVTFPMQ